MADREIAERKEAVQAREGGLANRKDILRTMPKLLSYDERRDDMDAFIQRLASYATSLEWSRERWPIHLSAFLQGFALDVYHRQPIGKGNNYDMLKKALQRRYLMTEEGSEKIYVQPGLKEASSLVSL